MSKVVFEPITIRQAEAENDSRLFVLNRHKPGANINLNVTSSNGEKIIVTLPISPCPVDVSNFCEKESVLKSPVFRRLVASGYVALIKTEQAAKFVAEDPRGIRETKRIFQANTDGDAFLAETSTGGIESTFAGSGASLAEVVGASSPNIFIESMILRSKSEDANDLISELDARIDTLTRQEVEYLSNHAHSQQIKEWAVEAMSMID